MAGRPEELADRGQPGGTTPRMMAQPGVEVPDGFTLDGSDPSPVAQAIVEGLARAALPQPGN